MKALKKPPALRRGDTIGVIATSSPVKKGLLERGVQELERIGYRVVLGEGVLSRRGFFAGEHCERAQALLAFLEDPGIKAVFCARGGYGSNYVVEFLAAPAVLRRLKGMAPKIVMGYSDVSTLLLFLYQRLGWVTFQGPMLTKDFAEGEAGYDRAVLEGILSSSANRSNLESDAFSLRAGVVQGRLLGGCLSLLTATLGTPEEIDTRGTILLLEDIDESPYRVDRMLFHLRQAGKFREVKAVVFGEMVGCRQSSTPADDLRDVILETLKGLEVPVAFGLRFGHTTGRTLTVPLGVRARLSAGEQVKLTLLEPAVRA